MNKQLYKMPRSLKRYLTLQSTGDAHRDGVIRRAMISADKARQDFKNKRSSAQDLTDTIAEPTQTTV